MVVASCKNVVKLWHSLIECFQLGCLCVYFCVQLESNSQYLLGLGVELFEILLLVGYLRRGGLLWFLESLLDWLERLNVDHLRKSLVKVKLTCCRGTIIHELVRLRYELWIWNTSLKQLFDHFGLNRYVLIFRLIESQPSVFLIEFADLGLEILNPLLSKVRHCVSVGYRHFGRSYVRIRRKPLELGY